MLAPGGKRAGLTDVFAMDGGKIRLLIIEPVSDRGGVSQYILSIIKNLPRVKFDIHVAASGDGALFDQLRRDGVSVHQVPADYGVVSFIPAVLSVRRFLRKGHFDLIHAHTAKAGFLCSIANKGSRAKLIYTGHGARFAQKENGFMKSVFFRLERFICTSASAVTVLSRHELEEGIRSKLFAHGTPEVISVSIDVEPFVSVSDDHASSVRRELGIPDHAFVVGMVGRVVAQKDPETFVRTAELVSAQIPEACFLWVGDGELREKTVRFAGRLGLSNRFLIVGERDPEEIPGLLAAMDLLLFTSRFEGLPIAIVEAMAAGKLVVAADVGSIREIVVDGVTGWLFRPGDHSSAASIIRAIHDHRDEIGHIGKAAKELTANHYAPKGKMARGFQNLYEATLGLSHN